MKNFLLGLSKLVLGIILAMLIMSLAGLSMARYFMTRMVEPPERPTYENDLPEDRPQASAPSAEAEVEPEADIPEPEPEPESEPEPEPEPETSTGSDYAAYATTNLNLRSGPGTTFGTVGGVSPDEGLTVIGEEGGWLNVILSDGSEGWVSGNYVVSE